jgi:hypothetical protein
VQDLEVPFWARNASEVGLDRSMDLPCFEPKLKGDYNPPFTCGSDTRQSIIKYFVRDYINHEAKGQASGHPSSSTTDAADKDTPGIISLAEQLMREQIAKLKAAWSDVRKYDCECPPPDPAAPIWPPPPQEYSLACCRSYDNEDDNNNNNNHSPLVCTCLDGETESSACCFNNFLPKSLDVLFDEIPADDVVRKVISQVGPYLKTIFTEPKNQAFKKYNDPAKVARWNWINAGMAQSATKASGLYSTRDPIMYYNGSEAGYLFRQDATLWETCAGLVSQVCVRVRVCACVLHCCCVLRISHRLFPANSVTDQHMRMRVRVRTMMMLL